MTDRKRSAECQGVRVQRTVIAEVLVENRGQHERLVQQLCDSLLIRLNAHDTVLSE
jgi:hypothetical protein